MTGLYVLGLITLHVFITLVVMCAGTFTALALGVRNRLLLLMIGLSTFGVLSALVFWMYLIGPGFGHGVAIACLVASAITTVVSGVAVLRRGLAGVLRPMLPPTGFFAAYSLFIAAIGFLHGGVSKSDAVTRLRFIPGLSTDAELPKDLARQLQSSTRPLPHFLAAPWQASDRPPLQTGAYLLEQSMLGHDTFIHYEAVGIIVQSFWVFGVWAFMVAARIPNKANALALAVTAFSGFAIVNTFFVWPKLFPAAYLMVVTAALLGTYLKTVKRSIGVSLAVGLCVGCAMMGHPGSLIVVISIILTLLIIGRWPSWRLVLGGGLGIAVMYGPWSWFVKYYDPPGNFLQKWQLAGIHNFYNKLSLRQAVIDAYKRLGWSGAIHNKRVNLEKPFYDTWRYPAELWQVIRQHRFSLQGNGSYTSYKFERSAFFYYVPALGLMAFGIAALVVRFAWLRLAQRRNAGRVARHAPAVETADDWRDAAQHIGLLALVCLLINWIVWSLILIGPGSTWNSAGSYYLQLIGFCIGVIGWWLVSPRLCLIFVAFQSLVIIWIYGVQPPLQVGPTSAILTHVLPSVGAVGVASMAMLLACLWWLGRQPLVGFDADDVRSMPDVDPQRGEPEQHPTREEGRSDGAGTPRSQDALPAPLQG